MSTSLRDFPSFVCYSETRCVSDHTKMEGIIVSRAFVKENDAEVLSLRDDEEHVKKTTEWLRLQEKKLDFLRNDPKGQAIETAKRDKWIKEAEAAIAAARLELGI